MAGWIAVTEKKIERFGGFALVGLLFVDNKALVFVYYISLV